jgi:hypothetical protein
MCILHMLFDGYARGAWCIVGNTHTHRDMRDMRDIYTHRDLSHRKTTRPVCVCMCVYVHIHMLSNRDLVCVCVCVCVCVRNVLQICLECLIN